MPVQMQPALQSISIQMPPLERTDALTQNPSHREMTERAQRFPSTLDGPTLRCSACSLVLLLGASTIMGLAIAGLRNVGPMHIKRVCENHSPPAPSVEGQWTDPPECLVHQRIKDLCVSSIFGATILGVIAVTALGTIYADMKFRMKHGPYQHESRTETYNSATGGGGGLGEGGGAG